MRIIERPLYINRITEQLNRGMILVLVGQRRVGKSFILRQLSDRISEMDAQSNVIFIDKDFDSFNSIKNADDLYRFVSEKLSTSHNNYLLIDEVQDITGYETALRSLYAEDKCQIVVTGSNAYVFSSEIATKFSGRYIEIPIHSLDYPEFLNFFDLPDNNQSLLLYLQFGGMPGLVNYRFDEMPQIKAYLQGIYNTVVLKDIVAREEIRNVNFLDNLIQFLADNTGQLTSVNNIVKYLKAQGSRIANDTIEKYIRSIEGALITDSVSRYDIHGKRIFQSIKKYYFSDHGLRNFISSEMPSIYNGIAKILENAVYHHLIVRHFEVYVGVIPSGEIDFIARKGESTIYVQVAYRLSSDEAIEREFGNLTAIDDNYPKYVVTMEDITGPMKAYPGIIHIHLRDFLTMEL